MKRFWAVLLVMLLLFLSACDATNTRRKSSSRRDHDSFRKEDVEDSDEDTDENEDNDDNSAPSVDVGTSYSEDVVFASGFQKTAQLEETVLYNENDILITANSLNYTRNNAEIKITIENNSTESLRFSSGYEHIVVNGYMISDGYMLCDVSAGKKANETIKLSYDLMMVYGIYGFANISIGFTISDSDYDEMHVLPVALTLTNTGDSAKNNTTYQKTIVHRSTQDEYGYSLIHFSMDTVYERQNVCVVSQAILQNQDGDVYLLLEVANNSPDPVNFRISSFAINELLIYSGSSWTTDLVLPGTRNIVEIDFSYLVSDSYWELYGIQNIVSMGVDVELLDFEYEDLEAPVNVPIIVSSGTPSCDKSGETLYTSDNISIVFKTIMDGERDYNDDVYILLLAENKLDQTVILDDEYDGFSINGYMCDCSCYSMKIKPGQCALVVIQIYEYMFEDSGITEAGDIESFEMTFALENENYRDIDSFTILYPNS